MESFRSKAHRLNANRSDRIGQTRFAADMVQATEHCHIVRNDDILSGEPIIRDSRTPVRAIVEMWRIGVSPEEIPQRLPHLSLSKVFDALSYYLDHQTEINQYIEKNRISEELIDPRVRDL